MKAKIGSWITLNNPSIAEIMADAGFDWLCVDMEHSVIDYFEAKQLIMAIQTKGIKAYVRVGENNTRSTLIFTMTDYFHFKAVFIFKIFEI